MDGFTRRQISKDNVKREESEGNVADSLKVRMALMEQVRSGEKTLEEVQAELKKIKRNAKKSGKITRNQAYTGRYIP